MEGRHRLPRSSPGPVTMASRVMSVAVPRHGVSAVLLRVWPALPVLALLWPALHGRLLVYADSVIGYAAVLALVATLAVTPVVTVARTSITKLRWWYGNWVFFLGAAGLAIHLAYPPDGMAARLAGNSVDWTGSVIVVLLFPMTITSSIAAQKLLGPEWKRWQRNLVWSVWFMVGVHLYLMGAALPLAAYAAATFPAVFLRQRFVRQGVKKWRSGGYSTGGWWVVLAVLSVVAVAGVLVLAGEEVHAVVRAVVLA